MRIDLTVAYALTGVFGLAMVVVAAGAEPADASGSALVVALGERLGVILGVGGRTLFLVGFWCAVFSSMLGVWQGVPYLLADWWRERRCADTKGNVADARTSPVYRWFLLYLAFPPLVLQLWGKPLFIVVMYAVAGAFFMPFLAGTLLVMNNRRDWVGQRCAPCSINLGLVISLVLFGPLFGMEIGKRWAEFKGIPRAEIRLFAG
ncbi:MAG: Nramp family divalent metal transporter [Candidatus Synoicihabitans palmerolidicus]|nr:Nramp family divalent metal transporter [Candidatus Synoicihabitans palmerolidicus]